jgi:hypothetical protein
METKDARRLVDGNLVMVNNPEYHPKLKGVVLRVTYNNLSQDGRRCIGLEHINQIPNTYYESYSQRDEYIEPIPLTTEWLERFGFKNSQTQDKFFTIGNGIGISTADNKFRLIKGNFVCQIVLVELEFVHQLQNLCYDLGEELTVKELKTTHL